jgi:hypothetical protein
MKGLIHDSVHSTKSSAQSLWHKTSKSVSSSKDKASDILQQVNFHLIYQIIQLLHKIK